MSKLPISVCIIAKNEEKYIEGCLKRLKPYGFEIVVADTGSTDATKEIAAQYADKVLDFAWTKNFSAARNFCASHASNDWILALDCDEYVDDANVRALRAGMQQFPKGLGAFPIKNIVLDESGEQRYTTAQVTRFYNRKHFTFIHSIHEQLVYREEGKRNKLADEYVLPMKVTHYGYALNQEELAQKVKRNLDLLFEQLAKEPDNSYIHYQIGQSFYAVKEMGSALEYYRKALECVEKVSDSLFYTMDIVISIAAIYLGAGQAAEAVALCERYAPDCQSAQYYYILGNAYMENNQPLKALLVYIKTTAMKDADTLGTRLGSCYKKIISLAEQIGEYDTANLFMARYEQYIIEKENKAEG